MFTLGASKAWWRNDVIVWQGLKSTLVLQVLAESDQLRKEADDLGPRAELDHWKKRMARFNYLLDQLKSPDVRAVLGVLLMAKSKLIKVRMTTFTIVVAAHVYTSFIFSAPNDNDILLIKLNPKYIL